MRLLERYVFFELCRVFAALLGMMTLLLVFVGVLEKVKDYGLGAWQIVQILPFVVPILLPYTIPVTLLLTVCVVYGRMSGDREVVAVKAAGIPVLYVIWPSFFLGGVLSAGTILLSDQVIPWANASIERIATLAMEDIFLDLLRTQNQIKIKEAGVSITVKGVRDKTLIAPVFRYSPNGKNTSTVSAQEARLKFDLQKRQVMVEMTGVQGSAAGQASFCLANEVRPFRLPDRSKQTQLRNLRLQDMTVAVAKGTQDAEDVSEQQAIEAAFAMTTGNFETFSETEFQLKDVHRRFHLGNVRRVRTEYHTRFAMSMSCLFFVLVGSPFAVLSGKKQFLTSFLFVFAPILLVYYPIAMMTQNLSKAGSLEPSWAVWSANGVLLLASVYFLRQVNRN